MPRWASADWDWLIESSGVEAKQTQGGVIKTGGGAAHDTRSREEKTSIWLPPYWPAHGLTMLTELLFGLWVHYIGLRGVHIGPRYGGPSPSTRRSDHLPVPAGTFFE
uniref:Uncharacterized protein n=1 Tax=Oryza sativa subsp. japonica TaxID=39947 RepID=Q5VNU8_ORYSJ|nr:hypothetical protein [Oryza sativa Japonica Group]BAD68877.1 hypothetical protein [Oryza sativa Japonica Group]